MADLIIRKAEEKDVLAIEQIEKQCFAVPWSYESLYKDIVENKLAFYIVAEIAGGDGNKADSGEAADGIQCSSDAADGQICGYVGIWKIFEEGHITNVAVAPEFRRKHIGRAMLETLISVTADAGIEKYTLEVRAGNEPAIRLYEGLGFKSAGIRPGYYEDNGEDAVIMWR
ncbi:MAG: ribosomal protein S18-alanine N-acetyltransferase [Firmicutes bacterium]|nr:ribosomal protein S18-alanine N-acetyltransferase [Bacillota bacterium]